jgi:uncharacterized protein (TIGR00303 family)
MVVRAPVLFAAAPQRGRAFLERWRNARPSFWCVLAHTDSCLVPGLSAAGISDELRPLTPAADAEVVLLGEARCLPLLPSHPDGAAGPSGITRAALEWAHIPATFVGVGLRVWPETNCERIQGDGGCHIELGQAVPEARRLYQAGLDLGRRSAQHSTHLVLGESVPGGTTTALALLLALGYAADGRVSGSGPGNARALKSKVAHAALRANALRVGDGRSDALAAAAAVGDPMQPLVAGMAVAAAANGCSVLLAGGSQMLAVAALVEAMGGPTALDGMAIGTTRWVVQDPAADVAGLAAEVSPHLPLVAANLDFSHSRHRGLRLYEEWLVKEGVGAGGICVAALTALGAPIQRLEQQIDATYDDLLSRLNGTHA